MEMQSKCGHEDAIECGQWRCVTVTILKERRRREAYKLY
jgi:hypothetical protein